MGTGNRCKQFLNIQGSRFVGLFPMTTVEYTGDPFSIRNLSSLKEKAFPSTSRLKEQTFQRRRRAGSLLKMPIKKHSLMFSGKLARPREHPQGPCLLQTTDSTLRLTLPEGHPVLTWPDLNLGPGAPSPPLCCCRTLLKELRQRWSRGRRLATLNKTKFSAYLR